MHILWIKIHYIWRLRIYRETIHFGEWSLCKYQIVGAVGKRLVIGVISIEGRP